MSVPTRATFELAAVAASATIDGRFSPTDTASKAAATLLMSDKRFFLDEFFCQFDDATRGAGK